MSRMGFAHACLKARDSQPNRQTLILASSSLSMNRRHSNLIVFLHALESLLKLCDQWSFAPLETVTSHDAPEIITTRPLRRIVDGQQIFGRPARHKDDDVSFGGPVHDDQFAPLLN